MNTIKKKFNKLSNGKATVTFIASEPPIPVTGGGIRTFHFIKAISAAFNNNLFVLFPVNKTELPDSILHFCESIKCSKTSFTVKAKGRIKGLLNDLRLMLAPWSFSLHELILATGYFVTCPYTGKNILRKIFLYFLKPILIRYTLYLYSKGLLLPSRTLERYNQFNELEAAIEKSIEDSDILWIDFSSLLPFFQQIKQDHSSLKMICNAHNIEYKLLEKLERLSKNKIERKWYKCQATAMKKAELKGFSLCDLIITCSEQDKNEILLNLPRAKIEVISNGVDINYFMPQNRPATAPTILFTGTMGYEPNRDGVEYFIKNIFPYVIGVNPTCKFIIAGSQAAEVFKHHLENKNIRIISSPIDMRPIYDQAWIIVVPLRSGSGTRLKILEAMAMEKPVVTTTIGAEGIMVTDKVQLFVADEEREFAERINLLIKDLDIRQTMTKIAKETVTDLYNWERINEITTKIILNFNSRSAVET